MMLCLALRSGPQRGLPSGPSGSSRSARSPRRSPPPGGLALPLQLRTGRAQGRDLHAEFVQAPARTAPSDRGPALEHPTRHPPRPRPARPHPAAFRWPGHSPINTSANSRWRGAVMTRQGERILHGSEAVAEGSIGAVRLSHPCIQAFPAGVVGNLAVRDGESVLELSQASLDINLNAGGELKPPPKPAAAIRARCHAPSRGPGNSDCAGRPTRPDPEDLARLGGRRPGGCHLSARARHWPFGPAPGPGSRLSLPDP